MTETCVALFLYNKEILEHLAKTIKTVDSWNPKRIYIFSDGPKNSQQDQQKVNAIRAFIKNYEFSSPLSVIEHKINIGLRANIEFGVKEVFRDHESCIFLEDDVELFEDFWYAMTFFLSKFKNQENIGHISGWNSQFLNKSSIRSDFYLDIFPASYAWATWKDRWSKYDSDLSYWSGITGFIKLIRHLRSLRGALIWFLNVRAVKNQYLDSWAIIWTLSLWKNNLLSVSPKNSLCRSLGVQNGTHTILKTSVDENFSISLNKPPTFNFEVIENQNIKLKLSKLYKAKFTYIILRFFLDKHRLKVKFILNKLWVGRDSNPEPTD